jgi:serine/threonine protein kinase
VKPGNVIVTGGHPMLLDFSLARRWAAGRPRYYEGTQPYMAPEQCLRRQLTPATDVFGLGCLLYELLSGELAFRDGVDDDRAPLVDRYPQLESRPTPLRAHRPELPRELAAVIERCLRFDPSERYRGMEDVAGALVPLAGEGAWPGLVGAGDAAPAEVIPIRAGRSPAAPALPA